MKIPKRKPSALKELNISDLTGGLNLRDGLGEVKDNQLTDSLNIWHSEGLLKTRPAVRGEVVAQIGATEAAKINSHKIFKGAKQLISVAVYFAAQDCTELRFLYVGKDGSIVLPTLTLSGKPTYFVVEKLGTLYCFCSLQKIYKLTAKASVWAEIGSDEMYVPLIATGCKTKGNMSMTYNEIMNSGKTAEDLNILGDYYELRFNAYNRDIASTFIVNNFEKVGHMMMYGLLYDVSAPEYRGKTVTVHLTMSGYTTTHSVTLNGEAGWVWEDDYQSDSLKMGVCFNMLWFRTYDNDGRDQSAIITEAQSSENNLVIIAPRVFSNEEKKRVFNMTQCEWFSGASSGLAGGTRVFLCGNTDQNKKSLVCWSGLSNPLYFPQYSSFFVGDTSEEVIGFGKQSDMLIIFKQNEIWYTKHYQKSTVSADDMLNRNLIDYKSSSAYFPLIRVNTNVGCLNPKTVQLCRNRLVWVGNSGRVYCLVSENPYNERSVFTVSEMVERRIENEDINAFASCDFGGYYCLFNSGSVYLMEYNRYGYRYITSYSKTEDSNLKIPWYYWRLPIENLRGAVVSDIFDELLIITLEQDEGMMTVKSYCPDKSLKLDKVDANTQNPRQSNIKSMLATKLFDFGNGYERKNIEAVNLQVGNNSAEQILVELTADCAEEQLTLTLCDSETQSHNAGFICSRMLSPSLKQVLRMGIKLSCDGEMAFSSARIKYRTTSTAR